MAKVTTRHTELRLNLAGTCGQANLARTSLHNMGPSKNALHTFNKHFAIGFCHPIRPLWTLRPSKVQNFTRQIQTYPITVAGSER